MSLKQSELALAERGRQDAIAHLGEREMRVLEEWAVAIADQAGDRGFTSDDLRASLPMWVRLKVDQAPNAVGALMRMLAKQQKIERAPDQAPRPATHEGARGRMLPVWRRVQREG